LRRLDERAGNIAALDDAHFVADAGRLGIAHGRRDAGFRDSDDDVGVGRGFGRENFAEFTPGGMDVDAVDVRVRPRKVDELKTAQSAFSHVGEGRRRHAVVVDDDEIIKVHVHTNDPGVVLTEALTYGAMLSIKIENMREQHSELEGSVAPPPPEEMKEFGVVAVCAGEGIESVFSDLGVDRIITGGQTMNPSTDDILQKIIQTPSNTVYVLPNNKNIILAAQQCIPLTEKRVIVIPTRSIPQGVAAMLSIDGVDGAGDVENMESTMLDAIKKVHTALITTAARNSVFDGIKIKKGSHLALVNDALAANGTKFEEVISGVAGAIKELDPEFIAIYTGEGAKDAEIEIVENILNTEIPGVESIIIPGGQPVYRYIISAE